MNFQYNGKQSINEIQNKINSASNCAINAELPLFIYGDNFQGMSCLLKDYMGKIDLVYIDPPFNTNLKFHYSNEHCSHVSSSKSDEIAYSDQFDFEEYLEFIRERIYLIHLLLSEQGTLYLHIDMKLSHYLKIIVDEIFGFKNFISEIARIKSNPKNFNRKTYGNEKDVILVYAKNKNCNIFNNITEKLVDIDKKFPKIDLDGRRYNTVPCHAPGETKNGLTGEMWRGTLPPKGRHWRCSPDELEELNKKGLIEWSKNNVPRIKKFADEHKGKKVQDVWSDFKDPQKPSYPTEKNMNMLEFIVKQSSLPDSIIMDCFCGSGSFLMAGVKHSRKVIGIDNSKTAKQVALNRLQNINILNLIN